LTIIGSDNGLSMSGVRGLVVENAEVRGRSTAVDLAGCDAVEIRGTRLNASSVGLKLQNCRDVVLRDLQVVGAPLGGRICFDYCGPGTGGTGMDLTQVSRLDASGVGLEGWSTGLALANGFDVRLDRMVAVGGKAGFVIQYGANVTLSHSRAAPIAYTDLYGRPSSGGVGIALTGTRGFSLVDNDVSGSGAAGIVVTGAFDGTISRNQVAAVGRDGIAVSQMNRGTLADNRISGSGGGGLRITASQNLNVSGNALKTDSIVLEGTTMAQFASHRFDAGNTVDGRPVIFLNGCKDARVGPGSVGELIAVACDGLTIEGVALSGGDLAIEVAFSDRVRIDGVKLSGQSYAGILTIESGHVEVNGSTVGGAGFGIRAQGGSQLSAAFSRVNSSGTALQAEGLDLLRVTSSTFDGSEKGLVVMTTGTFEAEGVEISRNGVGLSLQGVGYARVFHNQFSLNTQQVVGPPAQNGTWDDGYPSGGNYWSNFTAGDRYGGQQQAETLGADRILDEPLRFGPVNDRYPLAAPWRGLEPPLLIVEGPRQVAAGAPIRVRAFAQDENGVAEVVVHFRFLGQGEFATLPMERQADGAYEAVLPGWNGHRVVEYYVTARDGAGNEGREPSDHNYTTEVLGPLESAAEAGLGLALLAGATIAASAAVALLAVLLKRERRRKAWTKWSAPAPKEPPPKGPDKPAP
ncbi:MAG TPA: NosD domain-containing protein, partial [Candidatus Thermoplasmatota archaeon]|nr:NosD domain-containing protein [Candidatus Thermoplasmatota archaeon]